MNTAVAGAQEMLFGLSRDPILQDDDAASPHIDRIGSTSASEDLGKRFERRAFLAVETGVGEDIANPQLEFGNGDVLVEGHQRPAVRNRDQFRASLCC